MAGSITDVKSIFGRALEITSPAEREAYLARACGGDPRLRAEVESLLQAGQAAGGFFADLRPPPGLTIDQSGSERPGGVIGSYKLLEQIGEGGMGTVWMAQQTEPVRRLVAVKLIKAGMDSRQVIARFEAERQALALMDHVNIARVLEAGTTKDEPGGVSPGRPYFVMDLVKGVPITRYCDDHHLTPRQRLELFIPVCQAVQHAHQKGVIHRDLKPSNVLVALYDGKPVPKVIDFGVAKAAGQQLTERTLVTGFGAIVGTLEYMSPEQAEVNQLDIDTRSDVYSLGVLLYELLTGGPPFTRQESEQGGMLEMLRVIREQEPTKPSTKLSTAEGLPTLAANRGMEPAKLTRLVRGELDWIVMKALEKDRNRRYETANGLAMDVRRYLEDEPVLACPPSAGYRLRKFARRNKGRLAVAAGVLLAVTVMAVSIGWAVRDRVARAEEIARAEAARRADVAVRVRDSLSAARALIAENKLAPGREKLAQARAQLGNDGSVLGNLAAEVDAGTAALDQFQQFQGLIELAHQAEMAPLLEATSAADDSRGSVAAQATARTGDRRPSAAVPLLLDALQCYGILKGDNWTSTLEGGFLGKHQVEQIRRLAYEELLWLADDVARRQQGHLSEGELSPDAAARRALVYLDKAESAHPPTPALYALRALCRKALGDQAAAQADTQLAVKTPPAMAVDHYLRGQSAYDAKQLDVAVQAFEAAQLLEPTHYWSMMKLGYCLCDLGQRPEDFVGAARVFSGCILKRPDHAHAYFCRAIAYFRLGRYDLDLADSTRAIELDPQFAPAWNNRGATYNKLGQRDKAIADFSRAIELDPRYVFAWNNRGNAYDKLRQWDKASADFTRAIELEPKHAPAWNDRGRAYGELGQWDKAVADCTRAVELDPKDALAWHNRGLAYNKLGQPAKAVADCTRAVELDPKFAPAWSNRGLAYSELGQTALAVADFSRAIELDPKFARAWYNRGVIYDEQNEPAKAFAEFSQAIKLDPKLALAWYNRGVIYNKLGQTALAVADYTKAIELDPKHAPTWNNRGLAYSKLGQTDKAIDDLSQAIKLDPKHVSAWCGRGWVYNQLGQLDKAVADFTRAIDLDPNSPQLVSVYLLRAQANSRLGHFEQARTDYQTALQREPAHAWANSSLAWLLATCPDAKLRDPHKAVELARKAAQLAPKEGDCWKALGVAHYRAGDWKAAVAALDKSLELGPGGGAVSGFFLAMAHQKLGNHDGARKAYEQAVQWQEKNKEALEKDKTQAEDLRRFRAEAEEVLELKKN
jgi:tetratricopeptide (TPR) repeat protein/serine/threonine protein kinase